MALNDLFNMQKADKYTADGRAAIEDAGYEEGHVSHRKDGDYIKQGGSWVPYKGKGAQKQPSPNGITARLQQQQEEERYEAARRDANMRNAAAPVSRADKKVIHTPGGEPHKPGSLYKEDPAKLAAQARKEGNAKKAEFYEGVAKKEAANASENKNTGKPTRKDDQKRQTVVNFLMKKSQVPEEDAKKTAEGLPSNLLNQMYKNIKKDHGDKYDAAAKPTESPAAPTESTPEYDAWEKQQLAKQNQRAAEDPMRYGYEEPPQAPATAPAESKAAAPDTKKVTKNKIEKKTGGDGKPFYAIEGTSFYFDNPEEAENAVLAESRYGHTYARSSKNEAINELQKTLHFKLDTKRDGKHSMDDFIEKVGPNEYAAQMWSGGHDTSGTLLSPFDESGGRRNLRIKKENGKWKVTYTEQNSGQQTEIKPVGDSEPHITAQSVNAPRQLTGDTRVRLSQVRDARKTYQIGEISQATGLQKTANGWVKPKTAPGQKNTAFKGNDARELNSNVQAAAGVKRDVSAENRAAHAKADKERADRETKANAQASTARQEAESRGLTGQQMKDLFLAKAYEGATVSVTQRGMEAQGWSLTKGEDGLNVYEKPDGSKVTMQLEGDRVKSADYQEPAKNKAPEGFSLFASGENPKSRGGEYKVFRSGTELIRYDETGYDERAGGKQYSAMESGPGGKRRFFDTAQEAADWIKSGSPREKESPAPARKPPMEAPQTKRNMKSAEFTKQYGNQPFNPNRGQTFVWKDKEGEETMGEVREVSRNAHSPSGIARVVFEDINDGEFIEGIVQFDNWDNKRNGVEQIIVAKDEAHAKELYQKMVRRTQDSAPLTGESKIRVKE